MKLAALISIILLSTAANAAEPAFDCSKASGEIEPMICSDDELAALDQTLADVYASALKVLAGVDDRPGAEKQERTLKATQRGWIKGRNDCWKADDKEQCVADSYKTRTAELQVQYRLLPGSDPVFYSCNENTADEIVVTFFETDPSGALLERGDTSLPVLSTRAASGVKYTGAFGVVFWTKGNVAQVEWPQGTKFECTVRD